MHNSNGWQCFFKECIYAREVRERSEDTDFCCYHIEQAKLEQGESNVLNAEQNDHITVDIGTLEKAAFPPSVKKELTSLHNKSVSIISRVSDETFVVWNCTRSQEHPLGLLHVRMTKRHDKQPRDKKSSIFLPMP